MSRAWQSEVTEYLVTFAATARIRDLTGNPRPSGCKKLHGYNDRWRIRVGDYRVVYAIDDRRKTVDINRIAHRKDVYE